MLASPSVHCPSPVVIFNRNFSQQRSQRPAQAFQTPMPIKTPVIRPSANEEDVRAVISLINDVGRDVMDRFTRLEQKMGGIAQRRRNVMQQTLRAEEPGRGLASRPTFCHMPQDGAAAAPTLSNLGISASHGDVVAESGGPAAECDSGVCVAQDYLERLVDSKIDQELAAMRRSISTAVQVEMTLRRLEQGVTAIMQTQARSAWIK